MAESLTEAMQRGLDEFDPNGKRYLLLTVTNDAGEASETKVHDLVRWTTYDSIGFDGSLIDGASTSHLVVGVTEDHQLVHERRIVTIDYLLKTLQGGQRELFVARLVSGEDAARELIANRYYDILRGIGVPEESIEMMRAADAERDDPPPGNELEPNAEVTHVHPNSWANGVSGGE